MLRSLVTELAIYLLRRFTPSVLDPARVDPDPHEARWQVRRALEYLRENYHEEFSLDDMAAAIGVSKIYVKVMA